MSELDALDIELLCYLVDAEIKRCNDDEDKKLFDLRLLEHKLQVIRRLGRQW